MKEGRRITYPPLAMSVDVCLNMISPSICILPVGTVLSYVTKVTPSNVYLTLADKVAV